MLVVATAQQLATGPGKTSTQGTHGRLPDSLKAAAPGSKFAANTWHRFGWHPGSSSHGGARLGFTGDNDSSDSQDSYMGVGTRGMGQSYGIDGTGYAHYPWPGAPSPATARLAGQVWVREGGSCNLKLFSA